MVHRIANWPSRRECLFNHAFVVACSFVHLR
jgi:hypothetical protein